MSFLLIRHIFQVSFSAVWHIFIPSFGKTGNFAKNLPKCTGLDSDLDKTQVVSVMVDKILSMLDLFEDYG